MLQFVSKFAPKRRATIVLSVAAPHNQGALVSRAEAIIKGRLGKRIEAVAIEGTNLRITAKTHGRSDLRFIERVIQIRGIISFRRAEGQITGKERKDKDKKPASKKFYMLDGPTESIRLSTKSVDLFLLAKAPEKAEIVGFGANRIIRLVLSERAGSEMGQWQSSAADAPVYLLVDGLILGPAVLSGRAVEIKPKDYLSRKRLAQIVRVIRGGALPAAAKVTGTLLGGN